MKAQNATEQSADCRPPLYKVDKSFKEVSPLSRRILHPVALILIGLGVIGFLFSLYSHPLKMLAIFAGIAVLGTIGFLLFKHFRNKRPDSNMSGYNRAVKQSAKKYKKQRKPRQPSHLKVVNSKKAAPKNAQKSSLQKRKQENNLKVIDGKKRKKKNRALF